MSSLATGAAGYIGSHMVRRLVEDGRTIVVVDDLLLGASAKRRSSLHRIVTDAWAWHSGAQRSALLPTTQVRSKEDGAHAQ